MSAQIASNGKISLTQAELAYLNDFLAAGDRTGFYMAYYNMTGSQQAILQAQISSFSGGNGGTAYAANAILQTHFGPQGQYLGIYKTSQLVAESAMTVIRDSVESNPHGDGFIDSAIMFASAKQAWVDIGQGNQFPGDLLIWADTALGLTGLEPDEQSLWEDLVDLFGTDTNPESLANKLKSWGSLAALGGTALGARLFGKVRSDYEGDPAYRIVETPDGYWASVVRVSDGKTVAVVDDSLAMSGPDILNALSTAFSSLLVPILPLIVSAFSSFRKSLTEHTPGFDGELYTHAENPAFTTMPTQLHVIPTSGNDTLWGTDGLGGLFFANDAINAGGGNDVIFGGDGNDILHGGANDDILYGQKDDDSLFGDDGNDVLRGGSGNDTLDGGIGDDILDGGDNNPDTVSGNDTLRGGAGEDTLSGGAGTDNLYGEAGSDTYIFKTGDGNDTIKGDDNDGKIVLNGIELTGANSKSTPDKSGRPTWSWTQSGQTFHAILMDGDLTNGGTLWVGSGNGPAFGTDRIIIEQFKTGDLGLALSSTQRTALLPDTHLNPFLNPDYVVSALSTELEEGQSRTITLALDQTAVAGQVVRFAASALSSFLKLVKGDDTLSFNPDGTVDVTLTAGQTSLTFALLSQGDVDTDTDLTLSATLLDAGGQPIGIASSLNIAFDASDSVSNANATEHYWYSEVELVIGSTHAYRMVGSGPLGISSGAENETYNFTTDAVARQIDNPAAYFSEYIDRTTMNPSVPTLPYGFTSNYVGTAAGLGDSYIDGGAYRDVMFDGRNTNFSYESYFYENGVWQPGTVPGYLYGNDNDVMIGGVGDDILFTHGGNDRSEGGSGNDVIIDRAIADSSPRSYGDHSWFDTAGNSNNDQLLGGAGNDIIVAGGGNALLDGGADADELYAGQDDDTLLGGDGDDVLWGDGQQARMDVDTGSGLLGYTDAWTNYNNWLFDWVQPALADPNVKAYNWGTTLTDQLTGATTTYQWQGVVEATSYTGKDFLDGGNGNDELRGGGNSDVLYGGAGNDSLVGDDAAHEETAGDDYLNGEDGNDTLYGEAGADTLIGGIGSDRLNGDGATTIAANQGNDYLDGGADDDLLWGDGGSDTLIGGEGDDELSGDNNTVAAASQGNDYLDGGTGADKLWGDGGADTLLGGEGNDYLEGDNSTTEQSAQGDDYLEGGEGDDVLLGRGGADTLSGGAGADQAWGHAGSDALSGGDGDDYLEGDASSVTAIEHGDDYLEGGAGNDVMLGDGGADTLLGGAGDDQLDGDSSVTPVGVQGNDYIDGGEGNDVLIGWGGNDTLVGGNGNDTFDGGDGDDTLDGSDGNDVIYGGAGNDTIYAGAGTDYLSGDAGNDTYIIDGTDLQPVNGFIDTVVDTQGNDTIVFTDGLASSEVDFVVTSGSSVQIGTAAGDRRVSIANSNITLQFSDGQTLTLSQLVGQRRQGEVNVTSTTPGAFLMGGYDNDSISALGADATLSGGLGNDQLIGSSSESTTFLYSLGDNNDSLGDHSAQAADGSGPVNTLVLSGINLANLKLQDRDGQRFLIIDDGGSLQVGSANTDVAGDRVLDRIQFTDGSVMTWSEMVSALGVEVLGSSTGLPATISGTNANDLIVGGSDDETINAGVGDDQIDGGIGNDVMDGGAGSDIYVFGIGSGQDMINNADTAAGKFDRLIIDSLLTPSQVQFLRSEDSLVVQVVDGSDSVVVTNYFNGAGLDQIEFADGTIYTPTNIVLTPFFSEPSPWNDWVIGTVGDDTIDVLAGNDTVIADDGNDTVLGGSGNDTLDGGAGNDWLDGGTGADRLIGGIGSDTYVVDSASDIVTELSGEGTDFVLSSIAYTLGGSLENLTLIGNAIISGTGNALNNVMTGNDANNLLNSGGGDDTLLGGLGNDELWGDGGNDTILGGEGDDWMVGDLAADEAASGADYLDGGVGNDTLWGEAGADTLLGGEGDDNLHGDGNNVSVAGQGDDVLDGGAGNDNLYGYRGNDTLTGSTGNDSLYGGYGDDVLSGGEGTDILRGEDGADTVDGGAGNDFIYTDAADTYLFGKGDGQDMLFGGSVQFKSNVLPGEVSLTIRDTYNLVVSINGTSDSIAFGDYFNVANYSSLAAAQLRFSDGTIWTLPNVMTAGTTSMTASNVGAALVMGNDLDNQITGTSFGDLLDGSKGADTLVGGMGNDTYVVDMDGSWYGTYPNYSFPDIRLANFRDTVVEGSGEGTDTIYAYHVYSAQLPTNVENLIIGGINYANTYSFNLTQDVRRKFVGNDLNNVIDATRAQGVGVGVGYTFTGSGAGGEIVINGGAGADTMIGGAGLKTRYVVDNVGDIVIAGSGTTTIESYIDYTLASSHSHLSLVGSAAITGVGNALNNKIDGSANSAANLLVGGLGDDTYIVGAGDIIQESVGEGVDTVQASVGYTLSNNVENLTLTGTSSIHGFGNALDNVLTGNSGVNYLVGAGGNDQLVGGSGNDTYSDFSYTTGQDVISDTSGTADSIQFALHSNVNVEQLQFSRSANDLLIAMDAQNSIRVQSWYASANNVIEKMSVHYGDRWYYYTSAQMQSRADGINAGPVAGTLDAQSGITGSALTFQIGFNSFYDIESQFSMNYMATLADGSALPSWLLFDSATRTFTGTPANGSAGVLSIKVTATDAGGLSASANFTLDIAQGPIVGTTGDDILNGDATDNVISGLEGSDTLNGLDGNDSLFGGLGDDVYDGGAGNDWLTDWDDAGNDTLNGGDGADEIYAGLGNDTYYGGAGDDYMDDWDRDGNDYMDGGTGADEMWAGPDNDIYVVDDAGDIVGEELDHGIDEVRSSVTYTLTDNVEHLTLTGAATIVGTGNGLDNVLTGNSGNNTLYGLDGNDTLDGGSAGTDSLRGGVGDDTYIVTRSSGITITENAGQGTDTVRASITYVLGAREGLINRCVFDVATNNGIENSKQGIPRVWQPPLPVATPRRAINRRIFSVTTVPVVWQ